LQNKNIQKQKTKTRQKIESRVYFSSEKSGKTNINITTKKTKLFISISYFLPLETRKTKTGK